MKNNIFTVKLHDIILPLIDEDSMDSFDHVFLVMDFEKQDFKQLFNNTTNKQLEFNEDHVLVIMYNLLCAMNYLHSANIVHRDIKPSNLLISDVCSVKICDFGLSRSIKPVEKKADYESTLQKFKSSGIRVALKDQLTASFKIEEVPEKYKKRSLSSNIMSRWYRAPEVILDHPDYSFPIDIWSIGCTLGELIRFTHDYRDETFDQKRFLFPGKSCFPMSPCKKMLQSKDPSANILDDQD